MVRTELKDNNNAPTMELYNLKTDIGETKNLAEQYPEIIERALEILKNEHTEPDIEKFKIQVLARSN